MTLHTDTLTERELLTITEEELFYKEFLNRNEDETKTL